MNSEATLEYIFKGQRYYVPINSISIECDIIHTTCLVKSVFEFDPLPENKVEEILFSFPLDERCAVFSFEVKYDNKTIIGKVMERKEASEKYKSFRQKEKSASLMIQDKQSDDLFKIRLKIFPENSKIKIILKFATTLESLHYENSSDTELKFMLTLPLVLYSRYIPNKGISRDQIHALNKYPYLFSFKADIRSFLKINFVTSGNNIDRFNFLRESSENLAKVELITNNSKIVRTADLNLIIFYTTPVELIGKPVIIYEKSSLFEENHRPRPWGICDLAVVEFTPSIPLEEMTNTCLEFVFLFDLSGSMSGSRTQYAKSAIHIFLKSLPVNCFFQLVVFGSTFKCLFDKPVEYSNENVQIALEKIGELTANMGGTEILPVLENVLNQSINPSAAGRKVFMLTDGEVTNTNEVINLMRKHTSRTQMFTIGIGEGASSALVKGLARVGNGRAVFINSDASQLSNELCGLLKSSLKPCVTNVNWEMLNFPAAVDIESVPGPEKFPNLVDGQTYHFFFLLNGLTEQSRDLMFRTNQKITLTGKISSKRVSYDAEFGSISTIIYEPQDRGIFHRIAGRIKIQQLTDKLSVDNSMPSNKISKIISIGKTFNLISRFTSFIAVDDSTQEAIMLKDSKTKRDLISLPILNNIMDKNCKKSPEKESEILNLLTAGVNINGSWTSLDDELIEKMGLDEELSKELKKKDDPLLATQVAQTYFQQNLSSKKPLWELMNIKAQNWLHDEFQNPKRNLIKTR